MIIVLGYVGGEIRQGPTGAEYSVHPRITISATESTQFSHVKNEIYKYLGYTEERYLLEIFCRYDIGAPGPHFFQLIPLYEESGWRMIFQQTVARTNWRMIELYIEPKRLEMTQSQCDNPSSIPRSMQPLKIAQVQNPPQVPSPPSGTSPCIEYPADVGEETNARVERSENKDTNKEVIASDEEASGRKGDDWEDVASSSTPKSPQLDRKAHKTEVNVAGKKKYSREFLLTSSQQCTSLPVGLQVEHGMKGLFGGSFGGRSFDQPDPRPSRGQRCDRRMGSNKLRPPNAMTLPGTQLPVQFQHQKSIPVQVQFTPRGVVRGSLQMTMNLQPVGSAPPQVPQPMFVPGIWSHGLQQQAPLCQSPGMRCNQQAGMVASSPGSTSNVGLPDNVIKEKSISAIREFCSAKDEKEVAMCIEELNSPGSYHLIISTWVSDSFERKEMERDLLYKLLVNLCKPNGGLFSQAQLHQGLEAVLSTLEDAVYDAPKAPEYLGKLFGRLITENVTSLKEIGRLVIEGGEEPGMLVEAGLGGDVIGCTLEYIKVEKGDTFLNEVRAGSNLRLEDFKSRSPVRSKKLDPFLRL